MSELKKIFHFFFLFCIFSSVYGVMPKVSHSTPGGGRFIIHFAQTPSDQKEHMRWNQAIIRAIDSINNQLKKMCAGALCGLVHMDNDLGFFTVLAPRTQQPQIFLDMLQKTLKQYNVPAHITPDFKVYLASINERLGLANQSLTLDQLESLKRGALIQESREQLKKLKENPALTFGVEIKQVTDRIETLQMMSDNLFWHEKIPVVGLRDIKKPNYPFLPHYFYLWELAPHKGAGIKVALIDTGVAAFKIKNNNNYRKNQDLDMASTDFLKRSFNLINKEGIDPVMPLMIILKPYIRPDLFNQVQLKNNIIIWVNAVLKNNDSNDFINYFKENGITSIVKKNELTQEGKQLRDQIVQHIKKHFHLIELLQPKKETVVFEFMPLAKIGNTPITFVTGHGTHTFGLVGGRLHGNVQAINPDQDTGACGMAPQADILMVKAFNDEGGSDKATLLAAIKEAVIYKADVVNLSLKISDDMEEFDPSKKLLNRVINLIPYVVAASGNEGDSSDKRHYVGAIESYPGKLDGVAFDVGAFGKFGDNYSISTFSQYEQKVGPKIVAPGFNIISSGLVPNQQVDSEYVFMDGTSMACPIISGFVALMLGEFKNDFTREQLLSISYISTCRLHDNAEWNIKTLLGTIDMRSALFTLHVLRNIKNYLKNKKTSGVFDQKFNNFAKAVQEVLFEQSQRFAVTYLQTNVSLKTGMIDYLRKVEEKGVSVNPTEFYVPDSLENAISWVANTVLTAYDATYVSQLHGSSKLIDTIKKIFKQSSVNLFDQMSLATQTRLREAEAPHAYWKAQASKIQSTYAKSGD